MSRPTFRTFVPALALVAGLGLLAGCSGSDPSDGTGQGEESQAAEAKAGDPVPQDVEITQTIELYPAVDGEAVSGNEGATSDGGAKDTDKVTVGFGGLAVQGKLATLTLTFTPDFDEKSKELEDDGVLSLYDMFNGNTVDPNLIDAVNLKRYSIAEDQDGVALGPDDFSAKVQNHQTLTATYMFAAPAVDTVDVYLGGRAVFDGVKVTK